MAAQSTIGRPKKTWLKWLMAILSICVFITLCVLGNWQVQRLHWKEALIAQINQRMAEPPLPIAKMLQLWQKGEAIDYRPMTVTGTFDYAVEAYYYNTLSGTVGWNIFTPLRTNSGVVMVNRGFIPDDLRSKDAPSPGQVSGVQTYTGLARTPPKGKPNSFMPENDIMANIFFWKDHSAMAAKLGIDMKEVAPFFMDMGKGSDPDAYPKGGTTRITFPNNHLQYAVTWYGLAACLVLVSGAYLWSNRKRRMPVDA